MPRSQRPRKPMNPVPIEDRAVHAATVNIPRKTGLSGRTAALIATGAAAAGGAGYLIHRSKKKDAMSKNLVNPFEEVVVFGKAYPVALPVPSSTTIRALVPTGGHVGHGNDLKVVRNRKGKGGRATKLEHYRGGHAKQGMGPFGKAALPLPNPGGPSVANGLSMIANQAKPSRVPMAGQTPKRVRVARARMKVNSNIPDGARQGRSL